jgi:hypothetical protein
MEAERENCKDENPRRDYTCSARMLLAFSGPPSALAMLTRLREVFDVVLSLPGRLRKLELTLERLRLAMGRVELRQLAPVAAGAGDHEFQVYSQWGEDGIIQWLVGQVPIKRKVFVEFGVEDYTEANTRFLLVNDQWSGLVLDGSPANIESIRRDPLYWQNNLKAAKAFITRENIDSLLQANGISGEIGLLSVDIDGVDYWVWEAITSVQPAIVILEYNARFGPEASVTVPYDPQFQRGRAHYSHIYYGASLAALTSLGRKKGYALVAGNRAGNNCFFVRRDLLSPGLREITPAEAWRPVQFRESRDEQGALAFLSAEAEAALLQSLPLVQVP